MGGAGSEAACVCHDGYDVECKCRICVKHAMTRRTALRTSLLALGAVRSDFAASSRPTLKVGLDHPIGNTRTIQIEPCIAAHPSKPGSLIISGAEYVDGKLQLRTYASVDAGKNWITAPMGQLDDSVLSVNNWVVYGGDGTAYCSTLGQPAQKDSFIAIYRSDNEGLSWSNAVKVPGDGYDQPRMIASMERNARTVYVAAGLGGIAVLRSDNSGTSFEAASRISPSNLGNQPRNPLILIDGTLLVPFADFGVEAGRSPIASRFVRDSVGEWRHDVRFSPLRRRRAESIPRGRRGHLQSIFPTDRFADESMQLGKVETSALKLLRGSRISSGKRAGPAGSFPLHILRITAGRGPAPTRVFPAKLGASLHGLSWQ